MLAGVPAFAQEPVKGAADPDSLFHDKNKKLDALKQVAYHIEKDPSGTVMLKGELTQKDLPDDENWFMPIPVVFHFSGGKIARGTIGARGAKTPINLKLPEPPEKVELDPELWVLSDKTTTTKR